MDLSCFTCFENVPFSFQKCERPPTVSHETNNKTGVVQYHREVRTYYESQSLCRSSHRTRYTFVMRMLAAHEQIVAYCDVLSVAACKFLNWVYGLLNRLRGITTRPTW